MRFLLLVFILNNKAWAQNDNLKNQLQKIFSESTTGFDSFKKGIKKISKNDTIFFSNFVLEGSYDAEIEKSANDDRKWIFTCTIDSSDIKGARKSVENWKKKLKSSLNKEFQIRNIDEPFGAKGYLFIGNGIQISLFQTILKYKDAFSKAYIIIVRIEQSNN